MKLKIALLSATTFLVCCLSGCTNGPHNEQIVIPPKKSDLKKTRPVPQDIEVRVRDQSKSK